MMPRWFVWVIGSVVLFVAIASGGRVVWPRIQERKNVSACVVRGHDYFRRNPGPTSGPAATSADSLQLYLESACQLNPGNY